MLSGSTAVGDVGIACYFVVMPKSVLHAVWESER
jgi:hypothetical protein